MLRNLAMAGGTAFLLLVAIEQQAGAFEILHAPDAIRACLCLDHAVTALSDALNQESGTYEDQRKALAALESRANAARQQIDPANMAQRQALGKLLDQRDAAVRRFAAETTPRHNAIVGRYNDAADAFNRACGDKTYDWSVLQKVQSTLTCPATSGRQSSHPRATARHS